jgi:hypothetical protein
LRKKILRRSFGLVGVEDCAGTRRGRSGASGGFCDPAGDIRPAKNARRQWLAAVLHALAACGAILLLIMHVYAAIWVRDTIRRLCQDNRMAGERGRR